MWLLKLHFSVSILCLLTFIGFSKVFKDTIKANGYLIEEMKKAKLTSYYVFFIPLLNLFLVTTLFIMINMTKEEVEKYKKDSGDEKQS